MNYDLLCGIVACYVGLTTWLPLEVPRKSWVWLSMVELAAKPWFEDRAHSSVRALLAVVYPAFSINLGSFTKGFRLR